MRRIVQPYDEDEDDFFCPFPSNGAPVEWNWQRKTEELGEKTCPSATLSTTNPTWTNPGSNPGLRGGRPAANRLSHGTALGWWCWWLYDDVFLNVKVFRLYVHTASFIQSHCSDSLYPVLPVVAVLSTAWHSYAFATCSESIFCAFPARGFNHLHWMK
jgi:hypothetical protein